jgi:hypothetical protein
MWTAAGVDQNRTGGTGLRPADLLLRRVWGQRSHRRGRKVRERERAEIEIEIAKYRAMARAARDPLTNQRINVLIAELEQKLREIDG